MSTLYDEDDVAWAEQQVEKLRALAELRPNIDLDIEHLIEELEGIAVDRVQAARSHLLRPAQVGKPATQLRELPDYPDKRGACCC